MTIFQEFALRDCIDRICIGHHMMRFVELRSWAKSGDCMISRESIEKDLVKLAGVLQSVTPEIFA